ncbi:uncharacterized protein LOC143861455 [Tasmannia lanceolata]|uniref:uncharacterized protein LOC143861455 n=1 Tax=Tasmannia lanceolata TaxID=3420 RepID=UPI004062B3F9
MDPLKYLFEKPALVGRTTQWLLLLSEFDLTYDTQKSIKGRVIAEQLADAPTEDTELSREFPDEGIMMIRDAPRDITWIMYFDGASNARGRGVGIVFASPRDEHIPIPIKLQFECTNNMADYEACIAGLKAALSFTYISRLRNIFTNALATLTSMVDIPVEVKVHSLAIKRHVIPAHKHTVEITARCPNEKPWYFDIKNLISDRGHPPDASLKEKRALQKLEVRYVIYKGEHLDNIVGSGEVIEFNEDLSDLEARSDGERVLEEKESNFEEMDLEFLKE